MAKRLFSIEFKHDTACLVLDQGYSLRQASEAVGVGATAVKAIRCTKYKVRVPRTTFTDYLNSED